MASICSIDWKSSFKEAARELHMQNVHGRFNIKAKGEKNRKLEEEEGRKEGSVFALSGSLKSHCSYQSVFHFSGWQWTGQTLVRVC